MMYGRERSVPGMLYRRGGRVGLRKQIADEQKAGKKEENKFFHEHIGCGHKSII